MRKNGYRRHSRRSGYILLVTLLIIAIVGTLTIGVARYSMNLATATIDRQLELQTKWGVASCERYAFKNCERLLTQQEYSDELERTVAVPIPRSENVTVLGDQRFEIQLDDESSKLNLNLFLERGSRADTKSIIRELSDGLSPSLKPFAERSRRSSSERGIESWGQVFSFEKDQTAFARQLRKQTSKITCWGHSINYRVAPEDVIYETVKLVAGATMAFKVQKWKLADFETELQGLPANQRNAIDNVLTPDSTTHSVWVQSNSLQREQHFLSVRERHLAPMIRSKSFAW